MREGKLDVMLWSENSPRSRFTVHRPLFLWISTRCAFKQNVIILHKIHGKDMKALIFLRITFTTEKHLHTGPNFCSAIRYLRKVREFKYKIVQRVQCLRAEFFERHRSFIAEDILWNPKDHYHIKKIPSLVPNPSQTNPVHILTPY
jgi:hypothetical protein